LCKLNRVLREPKFGSRMNFALVEIRDEASKMLHSFEYRDLRNVLENYLANGFDITDNRIYKYLHHSQSQLKEKQFWFYYHDENCLSLEDAYVWMGSFSKERVVAKHAARIALCFTSTEATISIPAELVTYVRDIEVEKNGKIFTFTDGVGTISTTLRDEIQEFMQEKHAFSVIQIRYGGCKGTLSVDPRLDNKKHQLIIRDSMNKFITDHDILE
ncbi:unnamed protein product, partial [Didymodactylos carnosus]